MALSPQEWHDRFQVQALWSSPLRLHFNTEAGIQFPCRVLDVGCGTGALLPDLNAPAPEKVSGIDINLDYLALAKKDNPEVNLSGADVHRLPFPDGYFDLVLCHYFLMWTGNPSSAINEMKRVTRKGGIIAAFAEPDYGGRIDHPEEFIQLRELQIKALIQEGADPLMGRRLKTLFSTAGLVNLNTGVYQGSWKNDPSQKEIKSEWMVLREDLKNFLTKQEIDALEKHDQKTRESGRRTVYVPTFYCWGSVT